MDDLVGSVMRIGVVYPLFRALKFNVDVLGKELGQKVCLFQLGPLSYIITASDRM